MMDFFTKFRRLGIMVEKEVTDLQTTLDKTASSSACSPDGSSVLVLRQIQKEVQQMKAQALESLQQLDETRDFLSTVDHYTEVVEKNHAQVNELEAYLCKYGYQPLAKNEKQQTQLASGETACKVPTEAASPQTVSESCATPSPTGSTASSRLSGTPKMEDFGITQQMMDKYSSFEKHNQDSDGFLIPAVPIPHNRNQPQSQTVPTSGVSSPKSRTWSSSESIPEAFRHTGLCVTPGMLDGREPIYSNDSDSPSCGSQIPDTTVLFKEDDCSPVPPMMTTPGARQIERPVFGTKEALRPPKMELEDEDESPIPPVFTTPGLKPLHKKDRVEASSHGIPKLQLDDDDIEEDDDEDDKSPLPPVMITPGAKQISHIKVTNQGHDLCPQPDLNLSSSSGTPEPPNLTFNFGISLNKVTNQSVNFCPQPDFDLSNSNGTPEPPNLTLNYGSMINTMVAASKPQTTTTAPQENKDTTGGINDTLEPSDDKTVLQSPADSPMPKPRAQRYPSAGDEMPLMPKLTGKYSFLHDEDDKENVGVNHQETSPPSAKEPAAESKSLEKFRVSLLTDDQYLSQPDYLRRQISLDLCNSTLVTLNNMLDEKVQNGELGHLSQEELQQLLPSKSKAFMLIVMRLGRLRQVQDVTGHSGQTFYSFV